MLPLLRTLARYRAFTALNLLGLGLTLLGALAIARYLEQELTYDRHFPTSASLARLVTDKIAGDTVNQTALSPAPAAAALVEEYPEVEAAARLSSYDGFFSPKVLLTVGDRAFLEPRLLFADPALFDVFGLELVRGDPRRALAEGGGLIVSESVAERIFGEADPVGRAVTIADLTPMTVTGVFADLPDNVHVKSELFASFRTLELAFEESGFGDIVQQWPPLFYWTYLRLAEGDAAAELEPKLADFAVRHVGPEAPSQFRYLLEPFEDIHFTSRRALDLESHSSRAYVAIPALVGLFIVLIGCINFVNLATALGTQRAREIALRKVAGASRRRLVARLLGESVLLACGGLALAWLAFALFEPWLSEVAGRSLAWSPWTDPGLGLAMLGLTGGVGLAAGLYPAFRLTGGAIPEGLKGARSGAEAPWLRRGLVWLQLSLAMLLAFATWVAFEQLDLVRGGRLGLDPEGVVALSVGAEYAAPHQEALRQELLALPSVDDATLLSALPGSIVAGRIFSPQGDVGRVDVNMSILQAGPEVVEALRLELLEGRSLAGQVATEVPQAFLINRAARDAFGWTEGAGRRLEKHPRQGEEVWTGEVFGVVEDFQLESLRSSIGPTLLYLSPTPNRHLVVRLAGAPSAALDAVEEVWNRIVPDAPLDFEFLDTTYAQLYEREAQLSRALLGFAAIAVCLACLGVFGLVAFLTERRSREVAIRKVLGSSVPGVIRLFAVEFLVLVAAAAVVAWPAGVLFASRWLAGFAYRIDVAGWWFPTVAVAVALVTVTTVALRALPVALRHPVGALRDE